MKILLFSSFCAECGTAVVLDIELSMFIVGKDNLFPMKMLDVKTLVKQDEYVQNLVVVRILAIARNPKANKKKKDNNNC